MTNSRSPLTEDYPRASFWLAALVTFLLGMGLFSYWVMDERSSHLREKRLQTSTQAADRARILEAHLRHSLSATYTLATFVRNSESIQARFETIAGDMLSFYPNVHTLSLAPGGIVSHVMPEAANQGIIGFNPLEDKTQGLETRRARQSGELSVAGPLDLVQGGQGMVARYPVRINGQFWGFTGVTIRLQRLLEVSRLADLEAQGYHYQLWREGPEPGNRQFIAGNTQAPLHAPVEQVISLPNNTWTLAMAPTAGWAPYSWLGMAWAPAVMAAALLAYLVKALLDLRWHKRYLQREVLQRTRELTTNLERYRTLIAASNTGAWEYFHSRDYLQCSPEYFSMLGRLHSDYPMNGQPNLTETWIDLLHPEDREAAWATFTRYIDAGAEGMYENRFRLKHAAGHWVWILSRGQALRDEEGELRGITVGTHTDISQQVENEAQLELAAKVFERGSEGVLITDAEERIVMVNNAFSRITGYSEEEALGQRPSMLSSGRHDPDFFRGMWHEIEHRGVWQGEVWNRRKNGEIYPEWLSVSDLTDDEGRTLYYIGIISDISRLKEDQEEIHRLAYYDPLTHLPNRSLLEERATFALKIAERTDDTLALLFLDLDNFKNINDSLGHKAGDRLLQAFAERLRAMVREEDTFARPGGDEFILLLPSTDASGAAHAAQKLLTLLNRPFRVDGYDLSVSSSVGIALYPEDGDHLSQLYTNADIAMYRAKQKGRNTYSFFTPELQTHYVRLMKIENALRQALETNQFELYYQPQQEMLTGATIGFEALLRWTHPEIGTISPGEFIPIAESSGLIVPLGEWVLREATQQLRRWIDDGIAPPKIAINLSAAQFHQPSLPDLIMTILDDASLPPEYLELELTESMTMDDPERAVDMINRLHEAGVSLSMDDFGTGYSSLSYLKRFKISKLKIDQSFVRDITRDNDDRVIISTIITLAQSLGLRVIAEGVETREQQEFLRRLGCHDMQGYYFSRPLDAERASEFLRGATALLR
ncbi:bifunctional diguanylate cyclase/phosphodiesterase [Marinimicrobium locisalis]|uniref:bifunctional diguanylate cyclase/phosphodiesterase n=1 Tax=Marinimicrobium locisalis TaxID=546022 RepID=UPI0032214D10